MELLAQRGLLSAKTTLVHAIHVSDAEMDALAEADTVICSCPTTERNLGDGIIDATKAAARGIRFAFGSDSETQIDPLEDARELEYHLRLQMQKRAVLDEISWLEYVAAIVPLCDAGGAEALGFDSGVLATGRPADFFAIDLEDPSIAGNSAESLLPMVVFGLNRRAITDVSRWREANLSETDRIRLAGEIVDAIQGSPPEGVGRMSSAAGVFCASWWRFRRFRRSRIGR